MQIPYQKPEAVSESSSRPKCVCFGGLFQWADISDSASLEGWENPTVISPEILDEYRRVGEILAEEHPAIDLEPMLEYVIHNAVVFSALPLPERVWADPDDDKFLAGALASGSNLVVSGDRHLLQVSGYQNIEVLNPRYFLDKYPG